MTRFTCLVAAAVLLVAPALLTAEQSKPKAEAKATAKTTAPAKPSPFKSEMEKISYALGVGMASSFKVQKLDIDIDVFIKALKDAMSGRELLMKDQEARSVVMAWRMQMMKRQRSAGKEAATKNKKEGAAFLAKNKQNKDVVALESGLQYKVIKTGDGPKPKATDRVKVNYRGTLIDGTEFDSSYKRNKPAVFAANRVIRGWTEALQLMPVGSKWQLFVPSDLAYGDQGAGPNIKPGSTLIFEVELLGIEPPKPKPVRPRKGMPMPKPKRK